MEDQMKRSLREPTFLHKSGLKGGALKLFKAISEGPKGARLLRDGIKLPELPESGQRKEVVILGAGVGGLTTAYELCKHPDKYKVTIIEANERVGGRSLTVRPGDSFTEVLPNGEEVTQTCKFHEEKNQPYPPYLNAGPGRIPSAHRNVLNYCRELEVDLQVYVMESRSNLFYNPDGFKGESQVNRQVANDTRGRLAEELYGLVKYVKDLTEDEKKEMRSLLVAFGDLDPKTGSYEKGSTRSGYTRLPGVFHPGDKVEPLTLSELLNGAFWAHQFYQPIDFLWQTTSFQPVGGMDMIEKTFAKKIKEMGGEIRLGCPVKRIQKIRGKYNIEAEGMRPIQADVCVSNIPIPLLEDKLNLDGFGEKYTRALKNVFATKDFLQPTCKVGWQAKRRLWQDPEDPQEIPIYGGISYTNQEMTQMWYPSDNFHAEWGVLTGAYNYTANATKWGKLHPHKRLELAKEQAGKMMGPDFEAGLDLDIGLSIAWQNIPTQKGGWMTWENVPDSVASYNRLLIGDAGFFVVGDQVSYLHGWKEGAVASALNVLAQVYRLEDYVVPQVSAVPDTNALIMGWMR